MLRRERVAIEEHTERRTLEDTMRPAFRQTRASSPRQLPTDHDYAVSTREYQSDQPSQKLLDRRLALSLSGYPSRRLANQGCRFSLFLLTPVSQNAPRPQGFATPRHTPRALDRCGAFCGRFLSKKKRGGTESQHQNQHRFST
jgi:hypothetical protein